MPFPTIIRSAPASCTLRTLSRLTPPSTWTKQSTSSRSSRDPLVGPLQELLAGVAGLDRHAEAEIGAEVRGLGPHLDRRSRIERDADAEPVLASLRKDGTDVVHHLDVEGDAVATGGSDLLEVVRRVVDHQMAVDPAVHPVDHRRDRTQDDRPDRHRRDEVPVADVEVEDPDAGVEQELDLVAEAREVRRVDGRLDLDRANPLPPRHTADLRRARASAR